jgi:hypothetical protein
MRIIIGADDFQLRSLSADGHPGKNATVDPKAPLFSWPTSLLTVAENTSS